MKSISDFLGKFTKLTQESESVREEIALVLKKVGVTVRNPKNIKVRNGIATLGLSPVQKSEVALKQRKIIEALSQNPLTKNITVVR